MRLKGDLIEGVHYARFGAKKIVYNGELLGDWIANRHSPEKHAEAIASYLRSLPSAKNNQTA